MSMNMQGQILKNNYRRGSASRRIVAPPQPDNCVLVLPGKGIEVPAIFRAWIYDKAGHEFDAEPRRKLRHIEHQTKV
jgi:hypothetical protein